MFPFYDFVVFCRFVAFVIDPEDEYNYISYENIAIYVSSTYQYIILAIIFSKGKPYRKSMFTNCKSHTE
ncbi:hypothetical protein DPMN_164305 [Dreissena polymorpha]|uniref:Uncharacterized protein n=1 Tax=Dreissena polymorpha TaxID=45954 RepID=A0A9D4IVH1_DREPO|nr:hypothetical protein DPMN_164305 [Dreissena polymorpha]